MSITNHIRISSSKLFTHFSPTIATPKRYYRYNRDVYGYKRSASVPTYLEPFGTGAELTEGGQKFLEAFQAHGHKLADVYPLKNILRNEVESLNPSFLGLQLNDKATTDGDTTIGDLAERLQQTFCQNISIEASYVDNKEEREWIFNKFTAMRETNSSNEDKINICQILLKSQVVDNFLAVKFPTLKRYGCEGAESMIAFVHYLMQAISSHGAKQLMIGMNHRGRNNLLLGELQFPPQIMFRKIKGLSEFPPEALSVATGDVLSHLSISTDVNFGGESPLHVNLVPNPSHLEAVNPVAVGKCRARQQTLNDGDYSLDAAPLRRGEKVTCLNIHGDAAFTGQGVVMECLNMSKLPHFDIGGTIHLIVNNLLGFTTPWNHGRSTPYASDIGKMSGVPVIHVSGDSPEDVMKASQFAAEYRQLFRKDIIVDLLCFRRWGHNEMDDQSFTQPLTQNLISSRPTLPDLYAQQLKNVDVISNDVIESWKSDESNRLNSSLKGCENSEPQPNYLDNDSSWGAMGIPRVDSLTTWDTGCHGDTLRFVGAKSVEIPEWFSFSKHLNKIHVTSRLSKLQSGVNIDWSLAEAMAFGSLLRQNYDIRLCGQDVGRGTFSHRHCFIVDQDNGTVHVPLNHITPEQSAHVEVVNSLLSEEAVLGFEYGVSVESANRLVVWEAQFGDFFNGAQIIIDTFIASGEAKWMTQSGIVLLLPHGYDGAGPEHSSARIERFLQLTNSSEHIVDGDGVNMSLCNPTTPAQYFHLLRRQMIRNFRKPLVVISPKTLLRHPSAVSSMCDFEPGTFFQTVIGDHMKKVDHVVFCSGKHYYALERDRVERGKLSTAIVRLEELCPFPTSALQREVARYQEVTSFTWSQEEPRNQGAWTFVAPRFQNLLGVKLRYAGRPTLACPAVGVGEIHNSQAKQIMEDTFL